MLLSQTEEDITKDKPEDSTPQTRQIMFFLNFYSRRAQVILDTVSVGCLWEMEIETIKFKVPCVPDTTFQRQPSWWWYYHYGTHLGVSLYPRPLPFMVRRCHMPFSLLPLAQPEVS